MSPRGTLGASLAVSNVRYSYPFAARKRNVGLAGVGDLWLRRSNVMTTSMMMMSVMIIINSVATVIITASGKSNA